MTPPIDERLLALLDHYLAGECSSAEVEEVRAWLSANAENRAVLADVERIRLVAHNRPPVRSAEDAWKNAVSELELELESSLSSEIKSIPRARQRAAIASAKWAAATRAIAAGLMLTIGGGVWFVLQKSARPTVVEARPETVYTTARGQRAVIELQDGSQLTLGPESSARLAGNFGETSRDLTFSGQGYFKVRHDPARRFRVHTAAGTVEDIGTEFVIDAYPEMRATQVVVAKGKVALQGTALTRGQMGRVGRAHLVAVASGVDVELYAGWIDGRLSFRDAPLREAFASLGRWYDLDVKLADGKLASMPLTASFKNEPISEVLQILDLTLGMTHRVTGRTVTFYSTRISPASPIAHPNRKG